jgi:small subunit ribosomal protein S7
MMMARRFKPAKRVPDPDPIFNDREVARFINRLMLRGKKALAERIFYSMLSYLEGKTEEAPIEVWRKAMQKVRPIVKVKARRVGGSTYQVPMEVGEDDGMAIGTRWVIGFARKRGGRTMADRLAAEILDIYRGQGASMKKREETHKMAEANKAFSHYRF